MPLVEGVTYRPPFGLGEGHLQTIFPALFRKVALVTPERERIETPDGDFLDLDWGKGGSYGGLVVISHGLEGDSRNACVQGMAAAFKRAGWDVLAWNLRGCSGETNRLLRSYHSGATDDLATVLAHVPPHYSRIALVGFSLGGNITLKYLGDAGTAADSRIAAAVTFSVPCDLASSALELETPANRIYMAHFFRSMRQKVRVKMAMFPGLVSDEGLDEMRTFREFDGAYTAPMNGFASAEDYWAKASSRPVLHRIAVPTLLVSAANDPFLPAQCLPKAEAAASDTFSFENPPGGGHVGFVSFNALNEYWSETRAVEFVEFIC